MLAITSGAVLVLAVALVAGLVLLPMAGPDPGPPPLGAVASTNPATDPLAPEQLVDPASTPVGSTPTVTGSAERSEPTATAGQPTAAAKKLPTGLLTGADFPSGRSVTVRSVANSNYVGVETSYQDTKTGMLRAMSGSVTPGFTLVWMADRHGWAMRSDLNGLWVSAEVQDTGNDTGMLRARANVASDWELFDLYRFENSTYAFRNQANGRFVAAELGEGPIDGVDRTAMLRARSTSIASWELFALS